MTLFSYFSLSLKYTYDEQQLFNNKFTTPISPQRNIKNIKPNIPHINPHYSFIPDLNVVEFINSF